MTMATELNQAGQTGTQWPVPDSARATDDLLRVWGEVGQALEVPPMTHRQGLGRLVAWGKSRVLSLIRPVVAPPLMQQAAWNSEVLRRIVELEGRIRILESERGVSRQDGFTGERSEG
jgi:hypothetical protein